jgi:carboxyl-terminal processing protease
MKKIYNLIAILCFLGVFQVSNGQILNEYTYKFGKALNYINALYVDTISQNKLVESAITNMLKELDPHSSYLTAKEVKEMNEPLQGNFEGIGVSF